MSNELSQRELEAIAERELGPISWCAPGKGYLPCPGEKAHHNKTGRRDCMITLLPGIVAGRLVEAPTITCFHDSCADEVAAANKKLRSEIGKAKARKQPNRVPPRPGRSASAAPNDVSRTARTDKITFTEPQGAATPVSRTIRTVVFALRERARGEYSNEGEGRAHRSERSEPEKPKVLQSDAPAHQGGAASSDTELPIRLVRVDRAKRDIRAGWSTWVSAKGIAYAAQERAADGEYRIEIGQRLSPKSTT